MIQIYTFISYYIIHLYILIYIYKFVPIPDFLQKWRFNLNTFSNNTHLQHPSSNWDLSNNHRGGENPKLLRLSANDMVRFSGGTISLFGGVGIRGGWLVAVFFWCLFRVCFFFPDLLNSGKFGEVCVVFFTGTQHTEQQQPRRIQGFEGLTRLGAGY